MRYAIFDIETRIDKRLLNESLFRGQGLDDQTAYGTFRQGLLDDRGSDFFPVSFHVPVSIAIGSVTAEHVLESIETLARDDYSEERLVRDFWDRVERFRGCLVSFNGRNFDLPVLELQAFRHGCPAPRYFNEKYGHRYRHSQEHHYDLYEFITNSGMYRVRGGFDLLQRLVGLPGKGAIDGSKVQELWEAGRLAEIHRYCERDVLQTYYLFLRIELVRGRLTPERYGELLERAARFEEASLATAPS
ncbi:MAG: ribonuclease H-like domain-containing protein [Candidatus Binatia bacterium]